MRRIALLAQAFLLLVAAAPVYEKTEAMIAMRDGVRLHTEILAPKEALEALPFLIVRTPYGAASMSASLLTGGSMRELARDGYIFVFQDIRGRFESEGKFVMLRPPRDKRDPKSIDEGTDAYDTIGWLLKNVPNNNGRAGIFGISYPGWLTVMAMLEPHPALKAASEQASPADLFLNDDFYHNGAFRLSCGFEFVAMLESSNTFARFDFNTYDTFAWYLRLGPLSNVNRLYFHGARPTWNDLVAHPKYDDFWRKQALPRYLDKVTVPNLNVAGWWDQEDFYGPLEIYRTLEKHDAKGLNYLAVGPWNHGGWAWGDGRRLGPLDFGSDTAAHFREAIEVPWFAWWLKGKGDGKFPEARTFQTGSNRWESHDAWPPRNVTERNLYFRASGTLSWETPAESGAAFDGYVSDPAVPVPYRPRPVGPLFDRHEAWATWLLEDQRFVHLRPDVLSWETEPLGQEVVVSGGIVARLFASTSGSDSDWIVKLIDVYPEEYAEEEKLGGYQLMIANEVFRGRFRKSFEKPEPVRAGEVNEYTIDLHTNNHAFLKGHRIMVQVQSTWFPLIDRNPQKFVANIFQAAESDYWKAEQRVFRSRRYPSHVRLSLAGGNATPSGL